ncbi:tRNA pseudouridine(38-40) synthase TruA [Planctomycetota bacterium]|jgi:tRNA pseudouridine38-40 synthase|nr:tRNA pseudouridine(38-40) synthase TruA [Planctomycetota bacterium]
MTTESVHAALLLSYDGRFFNGWQRHPGKRTVQGAVEDAVAAAFGAPALIEGAGRTDRGAHALGQVATVELPGAASEEEIVTRLNEAMEGDVIVEEARHVPAGFHARKDSVSKVYRFAIWNEEELPVELERRVWHVHGKLDVDAMAFALGALEGEHDFSSFASSGGFERKNSVRHLRTCTLGAEGPLVEMSFEADGFLYKMVRNMVRAVVRVGEGKRRAEDMLEVLAAKDRKAAPGSAPASGLYLDQVYYERPLFDR